MILLTKFVDETSFPTSRFHNMAFEKRPSSRCLSGSVQIITPHVCVSGVYGLSVHADCVGGSNTVLPCRGGAHHLHGENGLHSNRGEYHATIPIIYIKVTYIFLILYNIFYSWVYFSYFLVSFCYNLGTYRLCNCFSPSVWSLLLFSGFWLNMNPTKWAWLDPCSSLAFWLGTLSSVRFLTKLAGDPSTSQVCKEKVNMKSLCGRNRLVMQSPSEQVCFLRWSLVTWQHSRPVTRSSLCLDS